MGDQVDVIISLLKNHKQMCHMTHQNSHIKLYNIV